MFSYQQRHKTVPIITCFENGVHGDGESWRHGWGQNAPKFRTESVINEKVDTGVEGDQQIRDVNQVSD